MPSHELANTLLICIIISISIYVVVNIDSTFDAFKKLYNKEQDEKHSKLGTYFSQLSKNDDQLRKRGDKHEAQLTDHEKRLVEHKSRLDGHDTLLDGHNNRKAYTMLDNHAATLTDHTNLINTNKTNIQNNEIKLRNLTFSNGGNGSLVIKNANHNGDNKITMNADGSIKFNVTSADNLKACVNNNCKKFVVEGFNENSSENFVLDNSVEKFAEFQTHTIEDDKDAVIISLKGIKHRVAKAGTLEKGTTGDQGPKGDKGAQGIQGDRGDRGLTGKGWSRWRARREWSKRR